MTLSLYTIGHSNHPIGYFVALLQAHDIWLVCDVRSIPASRFHPQFNQPALRRALDEAGIAYRYLGNALGGKPRGPGYPENAAARFALIAETESFRAGLEELLTEARTRRTAILCAERDPADCHRSLLICPHLPPEIRVLHILADGTLLDERARRSAAGERQGRLPWADR